MLRNYFLLLNSLCCWATLYAQPNNSQALQQQLFCDPAIVWAGMVDVDLLPDTHPDQAWNPYRESGLTASNFTQRDTTLVVGDTSLAAYIWQALLAENMPLYAEDSLQQVIPRDELQVVDWSKIDEAADDYPPMAAEQLEILRVRCYVYYNRQKAGFQVVPLAVGLITTEYDGPESAAFYNLVGWMPVTTASTGALDWEKLIHRDVDLRNAVVFKQMWRLEQCMGQMVDLAFDAPTIQRKYAPEGLNQPSPISAETLKASVSEIFEQIDPDTYELSEEVHKIPAARLIGSTFSIRLGWNAAQQRLYAQPVGYALIQSNMDLLCEGAACLEERMYLKRVFYTKLGE